MAVDLLQRLGLNKYEAEAYLALLAEGPLTGYELGKRSNVPLSKSYETLERLSRRGLVLLQPGDPPRYLAERLERLLAQSRTEHESVLAALAATLAAARPADPSDQFWVVRGRTNVLAGARALIDEAAESVVLGQAGGSDDLSDALDRAGARGCRVSLRTLDAASDGDAPRELVVLLADGRRALVGTLDPARHCQAVVSGNPGLVAPIRLALGARRPERALAAVGPSGAPSTDDPRQAAWLDWEARKHERLRRLTA